MYIPIDENANSQISYIIESGICFLTICERSYPRRLAFLYLEELAKEFIQSYGDQMNQPGLRPYAFVKFDTFMQRTKHVYQDTRATSNLDKLNSDLQDVTKVMTKNIEDLLYRGASLDRMSHLSSNLRDESLKYRRAARRINLEALWRQYGPVLLIALIMILVIYWRFF